MSKITFKVEELKKRLAQLGAVVSKKAATPVFGYVRLYAVPNGNTFSVGVTGADIDAKLNLWTGATADGPVDVLLPFAKLTEIAGNLGGDEASIISTDSSKARLTNLRYKAELQTHPLEKWGDVGEAEKPEAPVAELGLPGLKDQIAHVDYVVPAASGKFVVSVALLFSDGKTVQAIGTDGFRLAVSSVAQEKPEFKLLLPKTALELINKLEGGTVLRIYESEAGFFFETDTELLTVTRTNGEFPPYERIIPTTFTSQFNVATAEFVGAVRRTKPLADPEKPIITFSAEAAGAVLSVAATHMEASAEGAAFRNMGNDEVDIKNASGVAVGFSLDAKYLLDFLEKVSGDITVNVKSATEIVDFQAGNGAYRYLVMPATTPA